MNLRPDKIYPRVTDITLRELETLGVRGLMLDIDGTLMPTRADVLPSEVLAWLDGLAAAGVGLFILSNSRRQGRVSALAGQLGLPYVLRPGKPRRQGFVAGLKALGLPAGQVAMVGDQIYTDVWGANRMGLRAFLITHCEAGLWYRPFRRLAERPFMREKKS